MNEYNTWYFLGALLCLMFNSKTDREAAKQIEEKRQPKSMSQQVAKANGWLDMAVLMSKQRARRKS